MPYLHPPRAHTCVLCQYQSTALPSLLALLDLSAFSNCLSLLLSSLRSPLSPSLFLSFSQSPLSPLLSVTRSPRFCLLPVARSYYLIRSSSSLPPSLSVSTPSPAHSLALCQCITIASRLSVSPLSPSLHSLHPFTLCRPLSRHQLGFLSPMQLDTSKSHLSPSPVLSSRFRALSLSTFSLSYLNSSTTRERP